MSFIPKIVSKIEILLTNPKKFLQIVTGIIKSRFFPQPMPAGGWRFTTNLEMITLRKYANGAQVGVVEIGVLDGGTTKEMALVCSVPIYGIDPLIPDSMNKRLIGHEEVIRDNLGFYSQFTFIKDFSYNAVKNWQKPFDFIFIDGDHTYEAVRQDFEQWLPLLQTGGFMAFHDSAPVLSVPSDFCGWPGPVKLVSELKNRPELQFVETQDSLSIFRKN
jgi:hypothetical protein